jgi:hypothetical protein
MAALSARGHYQLTEVPFKAIRLHDQAQEHGMAKELRLKLWLGPVLPFQKGLGWKQ